MHGVSVREGWHQVVSPLPCIFILHALLLSLRKSIDGNMNLSTLNGRTLFTSDMPDVEITASDPLQVTVTCDGSQIMQETLWPMGGYVTLTALGELLEPYARKQLVCSVTIAAGNDTASCTVLFAMVDVGVSAQSFYNGRFLTILEGEKVTALGRREHLWYYGQDSAQVTANYSDGTHAAFDPGVGTTNPHYTCIDVSPSLFTASGKTLVSYIVTAGTRSQMYRIDQGKPDCAPILEFYNSFGVWEQIYCTGTHKVAPEYQRSQARINGRLRNYRIRETRKFEADTGFLTTAMAKWADELFRSDKVYVLNVYNGSVQAAENGREVVIIDSKSEVSNKDGDMPHFSFTYQYAQRIHNVLQPSRVGRIFDNTFDHTFN